MTQGDHKGDPAAGCISCHHGRSSGGAGACTEAAAYDVEWVEQMDQGKASLYKTKVDSLR